jgi:hypothetical protein
VAGATETWIGQLPEGRVTIVVTDIEVSSEIQCRLERSLLTNSRPRTPEEFNLTIGRGLMYNSSTEIFQ